MRKASLHILHEHLRKSLEKFDNGEDVFAAIIQAANDHPLHRAALFTDKKRASKAVRLNSNVELFNRLLMASRSALGHKFARPILRGDRNYFVLCDIATDAQEFVRLFELDMSVGFTIYIKSGLKMMGRNYRLNRFASLKNKLFDTYEKEILATNNEHEPLTYAITHYYSNKCGLTSEDELLSIAEFYMHDFILTAYLIAEKNADFKEWIDAQFVGFEFLEKAPEPHQLHTEGAIKRYMTHRPKQKPTPKDDWRARARQLRNKNSK